MADKDDNGEDRTVRAGDSTFFSISDGKQTLNSDIANFPCIQYRARSRSSAPVTPCRRVRGFGDALSLRESGQRVGRK